MRRRKTVAPHFLPNSSPLISGVPDVWWVVWCSGCSRGIHAQVAGPVDWLLCLNSSTVLGLTGSSVARAVLPCAAAVTLESLLVRSNRKSIVNTKIHDENVRERLLF